VSLLFKWNWKSVSRRVTRWNCGYENRIYYPNPASNDASWTSNRGRYPTSIILQSIFPWSISYRRIIFWIISWDSCSTRSKWWCRKIPKARENDFTRTRFATGRVILTVSERINIITSSIRRFRFVRESSSCCKRDHESSPRSVVIDLLRLRRRECSILAAKDRYDTKNSTSSPMLKTSGTCSLAGASLLTVKIENEHSGIRTAGFSWACYLYTKCPTCQSSLVGLYIRPALATQPIAINSSNGSTW